MFKIETACHRISLAPDSKQHADHALPVKSLFQQLKSSWVSYLWLCSSMPMFCLICMSVNLSQIFTSVHSMFLKIHFKKWNECLSSCRCSFSQWVTITKLIRRIYSLGIVFNFCLLITWIHSRWAESHAHLICR